MEENVNVNINSVSNPTSENLDTIENQNSLSSDYMGDMVTPYAVNNTPGGTPDIDWSSIQADIDASLLQYGERNPYSEMIDMVSSDLQPFAMEGGFSFGEVPEKASPNYNPYDEQTGDFDLSTAEGQKKALQGISSHINQTTPVDIQKEIYKAPINYGIKSSNLDRYYLHNHYDELGFHPFQDNESYYNINSTGWDDWQRARKQFTRMFTPALTSPYRSYKDVFGGNFSETDYEGGYVMREAMRIGGSSRGGSTQFWNDLALNSSYSLGIITNIILEEIALAGAIYMTGGYAAVGAPAVLANQARKVKNIGKFGKIKKSVGDAFAYATGPARRLMNSMNDMKAVRALAAMGRGAARGIGTTASRVGAGAFGFAGPETLYAINKMRTTRGTAKAMTNMSKVKFTAAALYRDFRALNLALSESKMEGALIEHQVYNDNYNTAKQKNKGQAPTPEELDRISSDAIAAGAEGTWINFPLILASNRLLIGGALQGFKPLGRLLDESFDSYANKIFRNKKSVRRIFNEASNNLLKRVHGLGLKGGARVAAGTGLRFLTGNIAEGFQELGQEATSHYLTKYYTDLFKHDLYGQQLLDRGLSKSSFDSARANLRSRALKGGIQAMNSKEGLNIFMSGFMMGGIVRPYTWATMEFLPNLYRRYAQPEQWKKYQLRKQKIKTGLKESLNDFTDNPFTTLDPANLKAAAMKIYDQGQYRAQKAGDKMVYQDNKHGKTFTGLLDAVRTNKMGDVKNWLKDLQKMDNLELKKAFPEVDDTAEKMKERLEKTIENLEQIKKDYDAEYNKNPNPYNPDKFKKGSLEYNEEAIKYRAYEHVQLLKLFTKDLFRDSVKRRNSVIEEITESQRPVSKATKSDISILLTRSDLDTEIDLLAQELSNTGDTSTPELRAIRADKLQRIKLLNGIKDVLYADANQLKEESGDYKGVFDKSKVKLLKKPVMNYLNYLAKVNKDYVKFDNIDDFIMKLIDNNWLRVRAEEYNKASMFLEDPTYADKYFERARGVLKNVWLDAKNNTDAMLEKGIEHTERSLLIKLIAEQDMYAPEEDVVAFLKGGSVPLRYYNEQGQVNPASQPEKFEILANLLEAYDRKVNAGKEVKKEKKEDTPKDTPYEESIEELEAFLKADPNTKNVIQDKWNNHRSKGGKLELGEFITNDRGGAILRARYRLKLIYDQSVEDGTIEQVKAVKDGNNIQMAIPFENWIVKKIKDKDSGLKRILDKIIVNGKTFVLTYNEITNSKLGGAKRFKKGKQFKSYETNDPNIIVSVYELKIKDQSGDQYVGYQVTQTIKGEDPTNIFDDYKGILKNNFGVDLQLKREYESSAKAEEVARSLVKFINNDIKMKEPMTRGAKPYELTLTKGEHIYKDGKAYEVLSSPTTFKNFKAFLVAPVDDLQDQTQIYDLKDFKDKGFNFFQWDKVALEDERPSNESKLRIEEPIQFYGFYAGHPSIKSTDPFYKKKVQWIKRKDKKPSAQDAMQTFDTFVKQATPETLENLKINIQKVKEDKDNPISGEVFKYKSPDAKPNPYIRRAGVKYLVTLVSGTTPIARLQGIDSVQLLSDPKDTNSVISGEEISTALAEKIFIIPEGKSVEDIKTNYKIAKGVQKIFDDLNLKDNEIIELPLGDKKLKGLDIDITPGQLTYRLEDVKKDRFSWQDLSLKTVEKINGKEKYWIINKEIRYEGGLPVYQIEDITNYTVDEVDNEENTRSKIYAALRLNAQKGLDVKDIEGRLVPAEFGRYTLVVKTPMDKYVFVQLKGARKSKESIDDMFTRMQQRADLTAGLVADKGNLNAKGEIQSVEFNDAFNNDLNEEFFIASNPGASIEIQVTNNGQFRFAYLDKTSTINRSKGDEVQVFITRTDIEGLKTKENFGEAVLNLFNERLDAWNRSQKSDAIVNNKPWEKFGEHIKYENFRENIPQEIDLDTDLTKFAVGASPQVIQNQKMLVVLSPESLEDQTNEDVDDIVNNAINRAEEAENYSDDINMDEAPGMEDVSPEETAEKFVEDSTLSNITDEQLRSIAMKSVNGEALEAHEKTIYKARKNDVNQLMLDIEQERSKRGSDPEPIVRYKNLKGQKKEYEDREYRKIQEKWEKKFNKPVRDFTEEEMSKLNLNWLKVAQKGEVANKLKEFDQKMAQARADSNRMNPGQTPAPKLVTNKYTEADVDRTNKFIQFMKRTLPQDFVLLEFETLDDLQERMDTEGVIANLFVMSLRDVGEGITGTIYTSPQSPFKYHEAFHVVFRMLLNKEQQERYLGLAKKELLSLMKSKDGYKMVKDKDTEVYVKSLQEARKILKNSADKYSRMNDAELDVELFEEYLADRFQMFKKKREGKYTGSLIKSLFDWLVDTIKNILDHLTGRNNIDSLFRKIDMGKFSTSRVANNKHTDHILQNGIGTTIIAPATITYASELFKVETLRNGKVVTEEVFQDKSLNASDTRLLIGSTVSMYYDALENAEAPFDKEAILSDVLFKNIERFNPELKRYTKRKDYLAIQPELLQIYNGLKSSTGLPALQKVVLETIEARDDQAIRMDEEMTDPAYEEGTRDQKESRRTDSDYGKALNEYGGYQHQRQEIRQYISSITIPSIDSFGESLLPSGEQLKIPVDHVAVYNFILNSMEGMQDDLSLIRNLYIQSRSNVHAKAFVDKFFKDIGIGDDVVSSLLNKNFEIQSLSNPSWFYLITKPLQTYIKGVRNIIRSPKTGEVEFYDPTAADTKTDQLNKWGEAYRQKTDVNNRLLKFNDARRTLTNLIKLYRTKSITNKKLESQSIRLSTELQDTIGIRLSPLTLQYWIASSLTERTEFQKLLVLSQQSKNNEAVSIETFKELDRAIQRKLPDGQYENIFNNEVKVDEQDNVIEQNLDGLQGRMIEMAISNAITDPAVSISSYVNAQGNRVWIHNLPSYNLVQVSSQNDSDYIKQLRRNTINKFNPLLEMPEYQHMTKTQRHRVVEAGGLKVADVFLNSENELTEGSSVAEYKFGSLPKAEYAAFLFSKYLWNFNSKSGNLELVPFSEGSYAEVPYTIRIPESASTVDFQMLPVLKSVIENDQGKSLVSDEALEFSDKLIRGTYESLREVFKEHFVGGTFIPGDKKGYNDREDGNAFKIFDVKELLRRSVIAKEDISITQAPYLSIQEKLRILNGDQKIMLRGKDAFEKIKIPIGEKRIVTIQHKGKDKQFIVSNTGKKNITQYGVDKFIKDIGSKVISPKKVDKKFTSYIKRKGEDKIYGYIPYYLKKSIGDFFFNEDLQQYIYSFEPYEAVKEEKVETPSLEEAIELVQEMELDETKVLDTDVDQKPEEFQNAEQLLIQFAKEGISYNKAKQKLKQKLGKDLNEVVSEALESSYADMYEHITNINILPKINERLKSGLKNHGETQNEKGIELANEKLNLKSDNEEFNLKQIFWSNKLMGVALNRAIEEHRMAELYKDPVVDPIKRGKALSGGRETAGASFIDPKSNINHPVKRMHMVAWSDEQIGRQFRVDQSGSSTFDRGDAGMYLTPKGFKYTFYGMGNLTGHQNRMMKKVIAGEDINLEEFLGTVTNPYGLKHVKAMLNSKKYMYRGSDGVMIKTAVFILSRQLTSVKNKAGEWEAAPQFYELHNLLNKLEKFENSYDAKGGTIAMAVPESALKTIKPNLKAHTDLFAEGDLLDQDMTELDANWLGLQVRNPGGKTEVVDPRQIKALIDSEQDDSDIVIIAGKEISIGELREMYQQTSSDRLTNALLARKNLTFEQVLDEIEKSKQVDKLTPNLTAFIKYARISLASSQANSHMLEMFDVDEYGQPKFNLNNPIAQKDFLKFLLNFFSKGVVAERQPGFSAALAPDMYKPVRVFTKDSIDKNGKAIIGKARILRQDEWKELYKKGVAPRLESMVDASVLPNDYDVVIPKGQKEVYYTDRLRANVDEYEDGKATGYKYFESVMAAHHKEAVHVKPEDPIPSIFSKAFGIRIPTQDKHSAVNLKIIDFLPPMYSSTIMVAYELIEISGSDFDIDKLYAQMANFYYDETGFHRYGDAKTDQDQYYDYMRFMFSEAKKKNSDMHFAMETWKAKKSATAEQTKPVYTSGEIEKMWFMWAATSQWSPKAKMFLKRSAIEGFNEERSKIEYANAKGFRYDLDLKEFDDYYEHVIIPNENYSRKDILKFMEESPLMQGALGILNRPTNSKNYKTWKRKFKREPYRAAQDNDLLDYKYALWGHKGMTEPQKNRSVAKAYEPAVSDPLEIAWETLSSAFPSIKEIVKEEGIDINDIYGQLLSWDANHVAIDSIGAIALSNISYNVLGKFNVKVNKNTPLIKIGNPKGFKGAVFNNRYSINPETGKPDSTNYRTQYLVSALVSVIVDNAKDRLAHKHNLNKKALGLVGTLVAMGVELNTALLMIQQPFVRVAYREGYTDKPHFFAPGTKKLIEGRLGALVKYKADSDRKRQQRIEKSKGVNVSYDLLASQVKSNKVEITEYSEKEIIEEIAVLNEWIKAEDYSEFIRNLSVMVSMTAGYGNTQAELTELEEAAEYLGLRLNNKEFKDRKLPFDVRKIFVTNKNEQPSNMYQVYWQGYEDIVGEIAPALILAYTDTFQKIQSKLMDGLYIYNKSEFLDQNTEDVLSYLTIRAYQNYLDNVATDGPLVRSSLNNALIYPDVEGGIRIEDSVNRINTYLNENKIQNVFMQYIYLKNRLNKSNKQGITLLEFNSFADLHDDHLQDMQADLLKLVNDPETQQDTIAILNYLIVKNGLQYKKGTFIQAVLPVLYSNILSNRMGVVSEVHNLFKGDIPKNDLAYEKVFGKGFTKTNLVKDLILGYGRHINSQQYLKSMYAAKEDKVKKTWENLIKFKGFSIDKVDSKMVKIVPKQAANLVRALNNSDSVHVFEGVDEGIDRFENNETFDKVKTKVVQLPVMQDDNTFFSDSDLKYTKNIIEGVIEDILDEQKSIVFYPYAHKYRKKLAEVLKNSPETFKYIRNRIGQVFGYDIATGKRSEQFEGREELDTEGPIVYDGRDNHKSDEYIPGEITIDIESGLDKNAKLTKQKLDIDENIGVILKAQSEDREKQIFKRVVRYKKDGTEQVNLISAPLRFSIKIPKRFVNEKEWRKRYFELVDFAGDQQSNMQSIFDIEKNQRIVGSKFIYREYLPVGSRATFTTAHVLDGQLPPFKDLQDFVNKTQGNSMSSDPLSELESISMEDAPSDEAGVTGTDSNNQPSTEPTVEDDLGDMPDNLDVGDDMFTLEDNDEYSDLTEFFDDDLEGLSPEENQNVRDNLGKKSVTLPDLISGYENYVKQLPDATEQDYIEQLKKKCK